MSISVFDLLPGEKSVAGSPTGPPQTTAKMLDFCARHDIATVTQEFPMSRANAAFQQLDDGNVRYRIVLRQGFILLRLAKIFESTGRPATRTGLDLLQRTPRPPRSHHPLRPRLPGLRRGVARGPTAPVISKQGRKEPTPVALTEPVPPPAARQRRRSVRRRRDRPPGMRDHLRPGAF